MTSRIKAINAYRPRVKRGPTAQFKELVEHVASLTGFNASEIIGILMALHQAIVYFNRRGMGVKLDWLGTYLPNVRLDGTLNVEHRQAGTLRRALNEGEFYGEIINRENIGKTPDELVGLWNVEHPDDPVR